MGVNLWLCTSIIDVYYYYYYYFCCCFILSLLGYYVIVSRHGVVVIINILNIKKKKCECPPSTRTEMLDIY